MENAFSVLDQLGAILRSLGGFLVLPESHVVQRAAEGIAKTVITVALDTAGELIRNTHVIFGRVIARDFTASRCCLTLSQGCFPRFHAALRPLFMWEVLVPNPRISEWPTPETDTQSSFITPSGVLVVRCSPKSYTLPLDKCHFISVPDYSVWRVKLWCPLRGRIEDFALAKDRIKRQGQRCFAYAES